MKYFTTEDVKSMKNIIDQALSRKKYTDHNEVVEKYGVGDKYPYYRRSEFVKLKIESLLRPESGVMGELISLRQYRAALYWDHIFNGENSVYHRFIKSLHDFIGGKVYFKSLIYKEDWLEAFDISCLSVSRDNYESRERQIYFEERNSGVLGAARRLRSYYRIHLDGDSFVLADGEEIRIRTNIASKINKFGAVRFISHLLKVVCDNDKFSTGRYCQTIRPPHEAMYCSEPLPKYPYGYLINIALGQISSSRTSGGGDLKDFDVAMDLARDYLAVLDFEVYIEIERALVDNGKLLKLITDQVCFDFNFSIKQADPKLAQDFLFELFNWVDRDQFRAAHNISLDNLLSVGSYLLSTPTDSRCLQLDSRSVSAAVGLERLEVAKILELISHDKSQLNVDYDNPQSATQVNFSEKPLIKLSKDNYVLISPLLCSLATYECALQLIRKLTPTAPGKPNEADSAIGVVLEGFFSKMFISSGMIPHSVSRKYKFEGKTYDCDLILSNDEFIVLFELKKKALTRSAVSSDPGSIVSDLAQTLFKSQLQLGIQNLCLNKNGRIEFADGEPALELGQRTVMRVAVTMFDWGDLQNRSVSDAILNHNHIDPIHTSHSTDIRVTKVMEELRATYFALCEAEPLMRNAFMNSIFLGIPQISHVLSASSDLDDFIDKMYKASRALVQGCDFFQGQNFRNQLMSS